MEVRAHVEDGLMSLSAGEMRKHLSHGYDTRSHSHTLTHRHRDIHTGTHTGIRTHMHKHTQAHKTHTGYFYLQQKCPLSHNVNTNTLMQGVQWRNQSLPLSILLSFLPGQAGADTSTAPGGSKSWPGTWTGERSVLHVYIVIPPLNSTQKDPGESPT